MKNFPSVYKSLYTSYLLHTAEADKKSMATIEEEEVNYYPLSEPEASEISGWRLVITILLIILMGFGAGYLIVRPLFEHHDR